MREIVKIIYVNFIKPLKVLVQKEQKIFCDCRMKEKCLFMESHRLRNRKSVLVVNCHFSRGKSVCFLYFLKKLELGLTSFHIFMKGIKQGVHSIFVAL